MTKLLTGLALAGAAALSFAAPASASSGLSCGTLEQCVETVTGPIWIDLEGGCIWFDTFPACVPVV